MGISVYIIPWGCVGGLLDILRFIMYHVILQKRDIVSSMPPIPNDFADRQLANLSLDSGGTDSDSDDPFSEQVSEIYNLHSGCVTNLGILLLALRPFF